MRTPLVNKLWTNVESQFTQCLIQREEKGLAFQRKWRLSKHTVSSILEIVFSTEMNSFRFQICLIYYQLSIFIYFILDYAVVLMEEVIRVRLEFGSYRESRKSREAAVRNCPAPIADSYEHVPKTELVERHICRFNKKCWIWLVHVFMVM